MKRIPSVMLASVLLLLSACDLGNPLESTLVLATSWQRSPGLPKSGRVIGGRPRIRNPFAA